MGFSDTWHRTLVYFGLAEDPEASRPYFAALRELAREHGLHHLSMGTSQDYRVAAEEGSTYVRVGSVLFDRNCFVTPNDR